MIRVETLVVDIDSLQELAKVVLLIMTMAEFFLADWTIYIFDEPLFDALTMKDVIAVKHSADRVVLNRHQTNGTLLG